MLDHLLPLSDDVIVAIVVFCCVVPLVVSEKKKTSQRHTYKIITIYFSNVNSWFNKISYMLWMERVWTMDKR